MTKEEDIPIDERVKRVLFFAKYEAHVSGAKKITLYHLLAGFLKEARHVLDK